MALLFCSQNKAKNNLKLKVKTYHFNLNEFKKSPWYKDSVKNLNLSIGVIRDILEHSIDNELILVSVHNNTPIGILVHTKYRSYRKDNAFPIAIFVDKNHRNKGIGTDLMMEFSKITPDNTIVCVGNTIDSDFFFKVQEKKIIKKKMFIWDY